MARLKIADGILLGAQLVAGAEGISQLHGEERFNALKMYAEQTLQLVQATVFPNDPVARQVLTGLMAAVEALQYVPPPAPPAQQSAPAGVTSNFATTPVIATGSLNRGPSGGGSGT